MMNYYVVWAQVLSFRLFKDVESKQRPPFELHIVEGQQVLNRSFRKLAQQPRKYFVAELVKCEVKRHCIPPYCLF